MCDASRKGSDDTLLWYEIGVLSMFCSYFKTAISGNKRSVGMRESRLRPVRHMGEERWLITLEFAYALLGSPMGHWL